MNDLQLELKKSYELCRERVNVQFQMNKELENNAFVLGDLEVADAEIPLLCKFLSSKLVKHNIIYYI